MQVTSGFVQLDDPFTAGIGCDLAGAWLLARGLIATPEQLTRFSTAFWDSNRYLAINVAKNRIDAVSGVFGLTFGFVLQGAGYVALLAGHHPIRPGWHAVIAGIALGIIAFLVVIAIGTLRARFRLRPLLVEMSRYIADGTRMDHPRAALLPAWGEALGYQRLAGEDDLAFVQRVFSAENLVVDVVDGQTRLWTEPPLAGET